jgi:hypothetical protein
MKRRLKRLKLLLSFVMPEKWRPKRLEDDNFTAAMAAISDTDPQYRAVMEIAQDRFALEIEGLMSNKLSKEQAEFQRGRAAGLFALLQSIEASRAEAKEQKRKFAAE